MSPALQVFQPLWIVCQVLTRDGLEIRAIDLGHDARVDGGLLGVVEYHTIRFLRGS